MPAKILQQEWIEYLSAKENGTEKFKPINLVTIQSFVKRGIDVNITRECNETALFRAAACKQWDIVQWLVEACHADVNLKHQFGGGESPLHHAVKDENLAIVQLLVEHGAKVDDKDSSGDTALHMAARYGYQDIAVYLLDHQADVNAKNYTDKTPLHKCCWYSTHDLIPTLVARGAKIDAQDSQGFTPLHHLALLGPLKWIQYFIDQHAKLDLLNENKRTPLHLVAMSHSNWEKAPPLIHAGASHLPDVDGNTPAHIAAAYQNWNLVKYLVEHGAPIDAVNKKGETPVHIAARFADINFMRWLIEQGADIDILNKERRTPLEYGALARAIGRNDKEVIDFLHEYTATKGGEKITVFRYPSLYFRPKTEKISALSEVKSECNDEKEAEFKPAI